MKRIVGLLLTGVLIGTLFVGCELKQKKVSYNISQETDNFNGFDDLDVIY